MRVIFFILLIIGLYHALEIEDRPYQIVRPSPEHSNLQLDEENIKIIENINENIAIVAVVGPFHSGKSFLLNQLMEKGAGFQVGPTVAAETKGLWIWGRPIKKTDPVTGESLSIFFLDTEGFYASNISEAYDAKIFGVSTLISSYLIFNSVKIIDQNDVDYLEILSKRTHLFSLKSQFSHTHVESRTVKEEGEEVEEEEDEEEEERFSYPDIISFPPLMWVVEDFFQDLSGKTATEWVQSLLDARSRDTQILQSSLANLFPSIEAHTLFLPSVSSKKLQNLNNILESELHPEYVSEMRELRQKVKENVQPKRKGNSVLTGRELASLLRLLVDAANAGTFPDVPSVWNAFLEQQLQSAQEDTVRVFVQETGKFLKDAVTINTVMTNDELERLHSISKGKAEELFKQLLFGLTEVYTPGLTKLRTNMVDVIEDHYRENTRRIEELCEQTRNDYVLSHIRELEKIKLPVPSKQLQKLHGGVTNEVLKAYDAHLAKFAASPVFTKHRNELESKITASLAQLTLANAEKLKAILTDAVDRATALYKQHTAGVDDPLSYNEFIDVHSHASGEAQQSFVENAQAAKEEPDYSPYLSHLKQKIDELRTEFNLRNDKKIEVIIGQTRVNCWQGFNKELNKLDLPVDESELTHVLKKSKEHALSMFTNNLEKFSKFDKFKAEYKTFEDQLAKKSAELVEVNVKETKDSCIVPFLHVKERIKHEATEYFFKFSLVNRARMIAEEELAKSNKIKNSAFRKKVIERFVDEDLPEILSTTSTYEFWPVIIVGVSTVALVVGFLILKINRGTAGKKQKRY